MLILAIFLALTKGITINPVNPVLLNDDLNIGNETLLDIPSAEDMAGETVPT